MYVTCMIDHSVFGSSSNENKKVVVDIDPNDEVENLKVLVTLKLTEIDPSNLQVFYRDKKLPNNIKVIKLGLQPEEFVVIKRIGSSGCALI